MTVSIKIWHKFWRARSDRLWNKGGATSGAHLACHNFPWMEASRPASFCISSLCWLHDLVIEPLSYERLIAIRNNKNLKYRLDKEICLDNLAKCTENSFPNNVDFQNLQVVSLELKVPNCYCCSIVSVKIDIVYFFLQTCHQNEQHSRFNSP